MVRVGLTVWLEGRQWKIESTWVICFFGVDNNGPTFVERLGECVCEKKSEVY